MTDPDHSAAPSDVQPPAAAVSVADVADALGRGVIAERVGVRRQAVSNAVRDGVFPSRWWPVIRDMCATLGHPCPERLFSFVDPAGDPADPKEDAA